MAMMTWLSRTLRSDRGDASPISLVMGSILTLIAALIIGGALTTMLGATSLAQSNSDLTTHMERELRSFEQTPFSSLAEEVPHRYPVEVNGRNVSIEREVFYDTAKRSYTLRLTAPRAVIASKPPKVCATLDADGKTPKGCFSLSSTIVGTPADLGPVLPAGITVSVRNVDGSNKSTNLVAHPDFEAEGAAAAWGATAANGASVQPTTTPRVTGTKELVLTKDTILYSQNIASAAGDSISSQLWANVVTGNAQVAVGTAIGTNTPVFGTSVTGKKWTQAKANATLMTNLSYRTAIRITGCAAGCKVLVDDVSTLRLTENLIRDTSKFRLEGGMTYTQGTDTFATTGVGHQILRYDIDAATMKGINKLSFSSRLLAQAAPAGVVGSIRVIWRPSAGADVVLTTIDLSGIGTENTPIAGVKDVPVGLGGQFIISVNQTGGPAKPMNLSSVSLTPAGRVNPDAVDAPSMEVAKIDAAEVKDTILRVSYQYDGSIPPEDLRVGLFCTTDLGTGSLSTNKMYLSKDTQNRNWYWSRLEIPALDRLTNCAHANIRVWSQSNTIIESSLVKNVTVMEVLDGVTSRNHGTDDGEE